MDDEPIKRGPGRPRKPKPDSVPPKGKAGRPKSPLVEARQMTVREYAMGYVFKAIDVWADIMDDENQPAAARAASAAHIVNRAIGQPAVAQAKEGDSADQTITSIRWEVVDPVRKAPEVKPGAEKAKA